MAYTLSALESDIRSYTEVDSNVFTGAILSRFIENAEWRIIYDLPMDSDRKSSTGNFALDNNTINVDAGALFVRAVEVFDSTSAVTGNSVFLQKKDQTYLREYVAKLTGPFPSCFLNHLEILSPASFNFFLSVPVG